MLQMNFPLNIEDSYDSIVNFLDKYYQTTKSDDAGSLLGCMMLIEHNSTFDAAIWEDWFDALHFIKPNEILDLEKTKLTIEEAYGSMIKFLEIYCSMGAEDNFVEFVASLKNKTSTILTWQDWLNSVEEVTTHSPRIRPYLVLGPIE